MPADREKNETEAPGLGYIAEFLTPDGRVVARGEDFDQTSFESFSTEVAQKLRARRALNAAVARACCIGFFAEALSFIQVEAAMDRLRGQGFRVEERANVSRADADAEEPRQAGPGVGDLMDKIDGLESELRETLDVLWRRGDEDAKKWISANYPAFFEERAAAVAGLHAQVHACDWPTVQTVERLSFEEERETALAALDAASMAIIGLAQDDVSNETAHRILQAIDFLPYARLVVDAAKEMRERLALAETFRLSHDVAVVQRGENEWAVFDGCCVLNRSGEWEHEPLPSSRQDDFIARTRFSFEEAFRLGEAEAENDRQRQLDLLARRHGGVEVGGVAP